MSYLVLARKWRPLNFDDVVGQAHVVRALQNALSADRVHHAYLFAGTRGVGKTTLARILAKALNCEVGVAENPCGKCASCLAVDEGRFVDLIEVDAASRTGVDDTRELLENVQYTPTSGRYKVYLIDEVHMLSRQSFNALLKTLEEPPPHVKFLLATTDPQKLPVTVLSRCLQFNLKRLPASLIDERMATICAAEGLEAEPAALARLARAANGSVRDALSLLDQARAYGDNRLSDTDVAAMLGAMDQDQVIGLVNSLAAGDASELLARVATLDEDVPDYDRVLDELATQLQRIAVIQLVGADALGDEEPDGELCRLAESMDPAVVQLYYQLVVGSRRDLDLAPDPRIGFEMALLRMIAFRPDHGEGVATSSSAKDGRAGDKASSSKRGPASPKPQGRASSKSVAPEARAPRAADSAGGAEAFAAGELNDWPAFIADLNVKGAARQLAEHCALDSSTPFDVRLRVDPKNQHLLTKQIVDRLEQAVQNHLGSSIKLSVKVAELAVETAADRASAKAAAAQRKVREDFTQDPSVRELMDAFDGEIVADSIQPRSGPAG